MHCPTEGCVFSDTGPPGSVMHIHFCKTSACPDNEDRQESMHAIKGRQSFQDLLSKDFRSTAGILHRDPGHAITDRRSSPGDELSVPTVATIRSHTGDTIVFFEKRKHTREIGRIVLTVGIQHGDPRAASRLETVVQRRRLTEISGVLQDPNRIIPACQLRGPLGGTVRTGIVDEQ